MVIIYLRSGIEVNIFNNKEGRKFIVQDQIEGRNAVIELLESGKDVNKILVQAGEKHGSITKIISKAKSMRDYCK